MKINGLAERDGIVRLPKSYSGRLNGATGPMLIVKSTDSSEYTRVLVVIDDVAFGASSLIGEARAQAPEAKLVLLYVSQFSLEDRLRYIDASEEKLSKVRMQQHEEALDAMSQVLYTAGLDSSDVVTVVEHGDLATIALKFMGELHIDLTVIGIRPTSALRRLFFRNPVSEIIENAVCDVLAVPVENAGALREVAQ
jgi:nucleotide-binding universal stress UspA family protein